MFFKKEEQISYSPGRLAKKIGVSKSTLMRHLKSSGLINECYRSHSGWWRIPYCTACRLATPEALAQEPQRDTTPRKQRKNRAPVAENFRTSRSASEKEAFEDNIKDKMDKQFQHYQSLARLLIQSGVTVTDLFEWQEQREKGQTSEKSEKPG